MNDPRRNFALTSAAILLADSALILLTLTFLFHFLPSAALHAFDQAVQQRTHALTSPRLTLIMLAFTWLGAIRTFAPALAAIVALLLSQRRRHLAALLTLPILWALLLNEALKQHFHRARPALHWVITSLPIPEEHTFSFPSGHSFFAVVLYGTLCYAALKQPSLRAPRRAALILLATAMPLAIGLSRIYLGMHYPTDVLAGYLAGLLLLPAVFLIDRSYAILRHLSLPLIPLPRSIRSPASRTGPAALP